VLEADAVAATLQAASKAAVLFVVTTTTLDCRTDTLGAEQAAKLQAYLPQVFLLLESVL
jgi:hypothetical protein